MSFQLILCPTPAVGPTREMRGSEMAPMKASTSRLQLVSCSPEQKDNWAFKMTPQEVKPLLGDCLVLFPALSQYGGRGDCILIDPPYNSGNPRLPYEDCRSDGECYDFIYPRIAAAYPFLSNRGCIAVHINDNQLGFATKDNGGNFRQAEPALHYPLAGGQERHR